MADPKKIKLYKVKEDGQLDKNSQLLPETSIDAVQGLEEELNKKTELTPSEQSAVDSGITQEKVTQYDSYAEGKQNTINDLDDIRSGAAAGATAVQPNTLENYFNKTNDYLENLKYGKVISPVEELVDGKTYDVLMENIDIDTEGYSFDDTIALSKNGIVELGFWTNSSSDLCVNYFNENEEVDLFFSVTNNRWEYSDGSAYDGDPLTFTVDTNTIINLDLLYKCLGISETEVDQTLKETKEDLPNWIYKKEPIQDVQFALEQGENYFLKTENIPLYTGSSSSLTIIQWTPDSDAVNELIWEKVTIDSEDEVILKAYTSSNNPIFGAHTFFYRDGIGWQRYNGDYSQGIAMTDEEIANFYITIDRKNIVYMDLAIDVLVTEYTEDSLVTVGYKNTSLSDSLQLDNTKNLTYETTYKTGLKEHPDMELLLKYFPGMSGNSNYIYGGYPYSGDNIYLYESSSDNTGYYYLSYYNSSDSKSYYYYENYDGLPNGVWLDGSTPMSEPPALTVDTTKIRSEIAFNCIYGNYAVTTKIEDKIENLEESNNELLKKKIYDYIESDTPVDGGICKLKENANYDSLLEGIENEEVVLYTNVDGGFNVNNLSEDTLIDDSIQKDSGVKDDGVNVVDSTVDGNETDIYITYYNASEDWGNEITLTIYKGGYGSNYIIDIYYIGFIEGETTYINQWQSYDDVKDMEIPYKSSYLHVNPTYANYVMKILQPVVPQTLEEKLDGVELKDAIYEKGENYTQLTYALSQNAAIGILDIGGTSSNTRELYYDGNMIIETYVTQQSSSELPNVKLTISDNVYLMDGSSFESNGWIINDGESYITSQEDMPKITYFENAINPEYEDIFYELLYNANTDVTLKQKLDSFKDWTYETQPIELVNGESYILPEEYDDEFFTKYADLFTNGGGTTIYTTMMGQEIDLVKWSPTSGINIDFILFQDINTVPETCVAYVNYKAMSMVGWYAAQWDEDADGWVLVSPPTPSTNPTLNQFNSNFIMTGKLDVFKDILGGDKKITLEQKLDEIETLAFISEVDTNDWEATTNPTIASTYSYQATIQNDNLINSIKCEVEFELTEMLSENYAPYYECDNESGELTIFAKEIPQSNINIKVIRWIGKIITNS